MRDTHKEKFYFFIHFIEVNEIGIDNKKFFLWKKGFIGSKILHVSAIFTLSGVL